MNIFVFLERKFSSEHNKIIAACLLSGFFTISGILIGATIKNFQDRAENQFELKNTAYREFLQKIGQKNNSRISRLLHIGSLYDIVSSDMQIQIFEDTLYKLTDDQLIQELYCQLKSDLQIVQLYGNNNVIKYADDILKSLSMQHYTIEFSTYPIDMRNYFTGLKQQRTGLAYGYEERVDFDDRLSLILVSKIFDLLIGTMRDDLRGVKTKATSVSN